MREEWNDDGHSSLSRTVVRQMLSYNSHYLRHQSSREREIRLILPRYSLRRERDPQPQPHETLFVGPFSSVQYLERGEADARLWWGP